MTPLDLQTPPAFEHVMDSRKQEEQAVKNKLQLRLKLWEFTVTKIQDNVFTVWNKDTWSFIDRDGKMLINVNQLRNRKSVPEDLKKEYAELFNHLFLQAGYREVDDLKSGSFILYDVRWKKDVIVPQNTKEYYEAWKSFSFFDARLSIYLSVVDGVSAISEKKRLHAIEILWEFVAKGYLRIEDLINLSTKWRALLKHEDFNKLLPLARSALLDQIGDPKWERTLNLLTKRPPYTVTRIELDRYLSLNLIDTNLHAAAVKKLSEVEKVRANISSQTGAVKETTRERIEGIKK